LYSFAEMLLEITDVGIKTLVRGCGQERYSFTFTIILRITPSPIMGAWAS
jgi:hypothetical protein